MNYIALIIWSVFESVLSTANMFGWAQLLVILESEEYFSSYCENGEVHSNTSVLNINTSRNDTQKTCTQQDNLLNLAFTIALFSSYMSIFIGGRISDLYGFRSSRLIASVIYFAGGVCMFVSSNGVHEFLFPGVFLTSFGGGMFIAVLMKVCSIIPKRRYTVMSFVNGGIDSSSVILLVFMLCYNAGISFQYIIAVYYSLVLFNGLVFTFTVFPKNILCESTVEIVDVGNSSIDTRTKSCDNCCLENSKEEEKKMEIKMKFKKKAKDVDISGNKGKTSLLTIMKSFNFISLTSFVAITCLRSFSFVGVINKQLKRLTDDEKEVEFYLTILGISQFCGLFFAFLTAFVLDWKPSNKHPDFSLNLAFLLTGAVSILVTSFLLIPVLQLQILSFISYGVMRSFLYSTHGSFVIKEFPLYHTGSLIGATLVFTSLFALVQFLMFALMEGPYNGDPTMVNVGLLVFQVMVMFYPLYLWRRSKEKQSFDAVNFERIQNQKDLSVGS